MPPVTALSRPYSLHINIVHMHHQLQLPPTYLYTRIHIYTYLLILDDHLYPPSSHVDLLIILHTTGKVLQY